MADTAVDTTTTTEISEKELKERKGEVEEKDNGSRDAPANSNGTHTNGAERKTNCADGSEETPEGEKEEEDGEGLDEVDHPVKRPGDEEEQVETKKQKTVNQRKLK
uniref:Prothymosin alpha n=1 Tax=Oncorhynchus tshawytscha TaxID=74940 RepID=A0A8C8HRC8_ONCTS